LKELIEENFKLIVAASPYNDNIKLVLIFYCSRSISGNHITKLRPGIFVGMPLLNTL